ncbi:MAG: ATP synthase F1 subunit epsilon [Armatimonadota bacterium]
MALGFTVEVVSADRKIFSGQATSLVVPAQDGYLGILRGHAPLIAALTIGAVTIIPANNTPPIEIAVDGGFVEVAAEHVTILADSAELASDIDVERARMAKERAEERLRAAGGDIDVDRAKAALLRAINRLRLAQGQGI